MPQRINPDLLKTAAYMHMTGEDVADIAAAVGRKSRAIYDWFAREDWPAYLEEARKLWVETVMKDARKAVRSQIKGGDGMLALKVLERSPFDPEMAPPKQHRVIEGGLDIDMSPREKLADKLGKMHDRNGHGKTVSVDGAANS